MPPLDEPPRPHPARGWRFRAGAVAAAVCLVAGLASCRDPRSPDRRVPAGASDRPWPAHIFRKWPKPDLALVLSGSMHGYLLPCGCSSPQLGGLERRYNFVQILRQKGWPVVAVDVGDVAQKEGPLRLPNVPGLLKYRYAMKGLKEIGYTAVGIGEYEASLPLFEALCEWSLNEPSPRVVVANLKDAETNYPGTTRKWELAKVRGTDLTVGVTGLIGPTVAEKMAKRGGKQVDQVFDPSRPALEAVLGEMAQKQVDLRVLLYQGSQRLPREPGHGWKAEAVALAEAFPQFDVVVCLNEEDEPSAEPVWVPNAAAERKTLVAALGHKGKYVGVVGVFRTEQKDRPFELRYQLVEMSEWFKTPEEQENGHPVARLLEDYTREVRDGKLLDKYGQLDHRLQVAVKGVTPTYIGSDKCKKCHDGAYTVWKNTPHSHAYETLVVRAKHPSNRQFDGECIVCHTVGFGYRGGFVNAVRTPHLKDVGCESCHGPGSEHAANPTNKQWQALMNEWHAPEDEVPAAKTKRQERVEMFCITCHDADNDVTWKENAFERKWKRIAHPTVPVE